MPPERNEKINNGIVGSIQETNKKISSSNKTTEKVNDSIADLVEDVKDAIEDVKDLASENISSKKISNDLSDLLRDLEQDLNDALKCDRNIDKELDDLVTQCHTGANLFKNSSKITDEQINVMESISTTCAKIDVDLDDNNSLEEKFDKSFEDFSRAINSAKLFLAERGRRYKLTLQNLNSVNKNLELAISKDVEFFEKNYVSTFEIIKEACELLAKIGESKEVNNYLDACFKKCDNAIEECQKKSESKYSRLLVVSDIIKRILNCIANPDFKAVIEKIYNNLVKLSERFK